VISIIDVSFLAPWRLGGSIIVSLGASAVQFRNSRGSVITPRIAEAATVAGEPM
jgi:hypothetical protein